MRQGSVDRNWLIVRLSTVVAFAIGTAVSSLLPVTSLNRSARGDEAPPATADSSAAPASDNQPAVSGEAADQSTETATIEALVRQLGDASYAVRQQAAKRLVEMGIKARPLLMAALADDDAEIRSRARQVLSQVNDADFRARLAAFENDLDGRQNHTLPCWDRFSRQFGRDKVARILFAEMQQSERELLESLDTDPRLAGDLLVARTKQIIESLQAQVTLRDRSGPMLDMGTIYALLLVSGDEQVTVLDQEATQLFQIFRGTFLHSLTTNARSMIVKKMLGGWIIHNSTANLAKPNLNLAFELDLDQGLPLAIKLLSANGPGQQPGVRQDALLAVGRWGNHEHIALVEPFLKDVSPCMPQQAGDPNQSQVRDVALAVLIHLSGQELKDYGLDHVTLNSKMLYQPGTVTFTDPLSRTQALEKWNRWAASSDGQEGKKADEKTQTPGNPVEGKTGAAPAPALPVAPRPASLPQQ